MDFSQLSLTVVEGTTAQDYKRIRKKVGGRNRLVGTLKAE